MTTRRQFLTWAGLALVGAGTLGGAAYVLVAESRLERAQRFANAYFAAHDAEALQVIARSWEALVESRGTQDDHERSFRALIEAMDGLKEAEPAIAWIAARIIEDFRTLNVVDLHGWTLSFTEVALAALVRLEADAEA